MALPDAKSGYTTVLASGDHRQGDRQTAHEAQEQPGPPRVKDEEHGDHPGGPVRVKEEVSGEPLASGTPMTSHARLDADATQAAAADDEQGDRRTPVQPAEAHVGRPKAETRISAKGRKVIRGWMRVARKEAGRSVQKVKPAIDDQDWDQFKALIDENVHLALVGIIAAAQADSITALEHIYNKNFRLFIGWEKPIGHVIAHCRGVDSAMWRWHRSAAARAADRLTDLAWLRDL